MSVTIVIFALILGLIAGISIGIITFPKREVKRLIREFKVKHHLSKGEFLHFSEKVDHTLEVIVKPNCETLYSTTFISKEKDYFLKIPSTDNYFSVAFLDEQTHVLGYITNEDLDKETTTSIVLSFNRDVNSENKVFYIDAKMCWVIVRYGQDSNGELEQARNMQKEIQLIEIK